MELEIISPEGSVYQGTADLVSLPGVGGRFDILPQHAPLIAVLQKGSIIYIVKGNKQTKEINGGFAEIKDNHLSICIE